jgi:hypothetical protein
MAIVNRFGEWHWIFSHRVLKRDELWRPPTTGEPEASGGPGISLH